MLSKVEKDVKEDLWKGNVKKWKFNESRKKEKSFPTYPQL